MEVHLGLQVWCMLSSASWAAVRPKALDGLRNAALDYQLPCVSLPLLLVCLPPGPHGQGAGLSTESSQGP